MVDVRGVCTLGVVVLLASGAFQPAGAVSERLKNACRQDYYAHCGEHAVGSSSLRFCMRRAQDRLSRHCVKELVRAGEVTKADIRRYQARRHFRKNR